MASPPKIFSALGTKGVLRFEITAHGKLAHSTSPELGHSAIHTLLDVLRAIRSIDLPEDTLLGQSTLNIGVIAGGRAPNVVADHAQAEIMFRTVGDPVQTRQAVLAAVAGRAEAGEMLHTPALHLASFDGLPTAVVAFSADIPRLRRRVGPAFSDRTRKRFISARTAEERIPKKELSDAVDIYVRMVRQLLATGAAAA